MDPDKLSGVFGGALRRNSSKRNPSDADKIVAQFKANGLSEDESLKKALPLINALESERKYGIGGSVKMAQEAASKAGQIFKAAQAAKAAAKAAEEAAKVSKPLERAPAKKKEEIRSIAERVAPQITGEYVRSKPGSATTVAGKTKKQFEREKSLPVDVRPMLVDLKPKQVDIESLKGNVVIGIPGDQTIAGKELYGVGDVVLGRPSPQYGGPLYGMYSDKDQFWASGLGAARRVQNLAKEAAEQYGLPVVGKYIMMGPESINYAQHFADANLQAIDLSKMTKRQVEGFNRLIRQGSPSSGPRPSFPGIEDKEAAYLHLAEDPELRKHFNQLMQQSTVVDAFNLPSGQDIRFAVTEPELRNLETGVTGYSLGRMSPEIKGGLELSAHPTYSHDIPGKFLGSSKYPIPYELSFPDTLKSIRENPAQAPHEFGSLKMVGPRQVVDQQLIDEIKAFEEEVKALTGKKAGGAVEEQGFSVGGIAKLAKAAKGASKVAAKAPQEAALETARKNAVKMLGLPENNTAMDRAKALGFDVDAFHGTTGDVRNFDPKMRGSNTNQAGSAMRADWATNRPDTAAGYADLSAKRELTQTLAQWNKAMDRGQFDQADALLAKAEQLESAAETGGQNVMPLLLRDRFKNHMANGKTYTELSDGGMSAILDAAKAEGKGGVRFIGLRDDAAGFGGGNMATHYGIMDPSLIRSRFAAFDPARVHENDLLGRADPSLLAAIATGGGGLAVLGMNKDKEKGKKK